MRSRSGFFRRYLLAGFVFQSVVIAGGYGTGRELVEFFLTRGPTGGLLAIAVSTAIWSAVAMVSFELARRHRAYDYRSFFRLLLGRGWVLFEILYVVALLLVLAVVAAAAGQILLELFGLPYWVGVVGVMAAIAALDLGGSTVIERTLAGWSIVLYAVYLVFFAWSFARFGEEIRGAFARGVVEEGWLLNGVRYAAYNLATIPAVLFVVRHHERAKDSLASGALAGVIAIVPGFLFFVVMAGLYPAILERPVPANHLLEVLGSRPFQLTFQLVLFGTLVETGSGMIHAVNERIARLYEERGGRMPPLLRPAVAVGFLLAGTLLSRFGLVDLIAKGYGGIAWGFVVVFVVPVLTIGVWRLRRRRARTDVTGEEGGGTAAGPARSEGESAAPPERRG